MGRFAGVAALALALRALLWDVDGTLAETERDGHRLAFNRAFAEADLPIHWDAATYGDWLGISGGRERITAQLLALEGETPAPDRVAALQAAKQRHYSALVASGQVQLRPGVAALVQEAQQAGLTQVIVTTSGRAAVQALAQHLLGPLQNAFSFWICGDDVRAKKPDPEAYSQASERLLSSGLAQSTAELLVLEDSRHGLAAARAAGLACVVTLGHYSSDDLEALEPAAVVSQLGPGGTVLQGPPCQMPAITLSYLQALLV
jgi:HAD superfamily hydrolase (TIGR01509 family)